MKLPFFEQIELSQSVLIAGAGGGFDVFAGLPLALWLRGQGKTVHLANWSFTNLAYCEGERPLPQLVPVGPETSGPSSYFPERYLAQWLEGRGWNTPIYAIQPAGVKPVSEAYAWMAEHLSFDTVILVDGGTDILMRGDEFGLGTPTEDIGSLTAAHGLPASIRKYVVCLGFGVDTYHGVCHAHFLENVAALSTSGNYLGSWSLLWEMPEVRAYADAVNFVHARMPRRESIVSSSIVSAVKGHFGDVHAVERTKSSQLFINPLMSQYWAFQLEGVAKRNLYLDRIRDSNTYAELGHFISRYRHEQQDTRPWVDIPF